MTPTFTPAPSASGAAGPPRALPEHPIVGAECLRTLSSYRFTGSFSLRPPASPLPSATTAGGDAGGLAGSLANLLGNVTFQGSALAPDRYQAEITFGGGGVQPLDVLRIGDETFSRFGAAGWLKGDQIRGFGGISQFDPQSLCQNLLVLLDAGSQTPAHETVNGVSSLRYQVVGPQLLRALRGSQTGGAASRTPTPVSTPSDAQLTVWAAENGRFPVRFQLAGATGGAKVELIVDLTDFNGKDIRIAAPS